MTKADFIQVVEEGGANRTASVNAISGEFRTATPGTVPAPEALSALSRSEEKSSRDRTSREESAPVRWALLAVDDTEESLSQIGQALGPMDVELICARSGEEALKLVGDERIALVLLDVSMPGMDGFETARRIRAQCGDAAPPVIFLTALNSSHDLVLEAYEAGTVDILHKPVNSSMLQSKVEVFTSLRRKHQQEQARARKLTPIEHGLVARRSAAERTARDISFELVELQHRNRELARRNQELDSFAHIISHDLRQPLQSILDYLELMATTEDCSRNPNVARWLGSSRKLGQNMQSLISGVLDYATIGTQSMSFRMVDGNAVLQDAIENLMAVIRQENAMVSYDPLPKILGSEAFLTRLFQNLVGNAIKYRRDEQPRIRVACERQEQKRGWLIRIIDNGRGIPSESLSTIFDMFTRVGDSQRVVGSGVGLAICKKIVELHGGQIWAESELGSGTEFCIVFPNFDDKS